MCECGNKENIKIRMARKEETPIIVKWEETKGKLINDDIKEPNLKEVRSSKRQQLNPVKRNEDFLPITE